MACIISIDNTYSMESMRRSHHLRAGHPAERTTRRAAVAEAGRLRRRARADRFAVGARRIADTLSNPGVAVCLARTLAGDGRRPAVPLACSIP